MGRGGALQILINYLAVVYGIGAIFAYTAPIFDYQLAYCNAMGGFAAVSMTYVISNRQFVLFAFPIIAAIVAVVNLFTGEDNSTVSFGGGKR
jgi:hypothetical protein